MLEVTVKRRGVFVPHVRRDLFHAQPSVVEQVGGVKHPDPVKMRAEVKAALPYEETGQM
jgi:hypothetical protein